MLGITNYSMREAELRQQLGIKTTWKDRIISVGIVLAMLGLSAGIALL